MQTLISLVWFICGIILATKWYGSAESNVIRMGGAKDRVEGKFWDWIFYLFLALLALGLPFGLILMLVRGIGVIAKWAVIIGIISTVVYSIYCAISHKNNVLIKFFKSSSKDSKNNEDDSSKEKTEE